MSATFYKVGGTVRDQLLGVKPKDIDYAVEAESYDHMIEAIDEMGGEIFLERPEFFTVRGRIPDIGAADFTLCRKEGFYSDNRHPDSVSVGTIYEDLARRDFTVNAIAQHSDGSYIDPYNGRLDISMKILRCVGRTKDRLNEDPLRMLRAIRFQITKGFQMDNDLFLALRDFDLVAKLKASVKRERAYEELRKCFEYHTLETWDLFNEFHLLRDVIFSHEYGIRLMPELPPL
jgi:tRNA nucleotidyltransferase (CCA-adding enzyme)